MFKNMKNQPNKATVKDGLPTAEEVLKAKVPPALYKRGDCYVGHALDAMQEYSDQQNADLEDRYNRLNVNYVELMERVSKLETENKDYYLKVKKSEFFEQVDSDCIESQSNEIDELKAWKESAMRELNTLDLQSLGKKLSIGLGQSISANVHTKVDGLLERVKELETWKNLARDLINEIESRQTTADLMHIYAEESGVKQKNIGHYETGFYDGLTFFRRRLNEELK